MVGSPWNVVGTRRVRLLHRPTRGRGSARHLRQLGGGGVDGAESIGVGDELEDGGNGRQGAAFVLGEETKVDLVRSDDRLAGAGEECFGVHGSLVGERGGKRTRAGRIAGNAG
jgi:hypothetical protein